MATVQQVSPGSAKKKEIYKYLAPWTVYSMNWSVRTDRRFRLAVGSFIEDYSNKASIYKSSTGVGKWKDTESQCTDGSRLTEPMGVLLECGL